MKPYAKQLRHRARTRASWLVAGTALLSAGLCGLTASPALAQVCAAPPVSVNGTQCTVTGGTFTIITANPIALRAIGAIGRITATNVILNLGTTTSGANTTGGNAQTGGTLIFNGGTIKTNSTGANASGQTGILATDNSTVLATNLTISLKPASGTTNDMTGIRATNGGSVTVVNSDTTTGVFVTGGTSGARNYGLVATGAGSSILFSNGTVSTNSRGAFGVYANNGGLVTLNNNATVTTAGAQDATTLAGGYGLFATGTGSKIVGTYISVSTAGAKADAVRADAGGTIELQNSTLASTSTTGGHALYALNAGSSITATNVTATVAGASASAARAESGATIGLTGGSFTTSAATGHVLYALGTGTITGSNLTVTARGNTANGARAEGSGSSIELISSQIVTFGSGNAAVSVAGAAAIDGGMLWIHGAGSSIDTTQGTGTINYAHGVDIRGAGSAAIISDTAIRAGAGTRTDAKGLYIVGGGMAQISDSSIYVVRGGGIYVSDAGSSVNASNTSVTTIVDANHGIQAANSAIATISGGSVTTSGLNSFGLQAASFARITATDLSVLTTGNANAFGAVAEANGTVELVGGSVTTTGDATGLATGDPRRPEGLVARSAGARLTATGTIVHTYGLEAFGAVVDDGATMILNDLPITTEGTRGIGLYAIVDPTRPGNATLTANNVTVETFGFGAHGGQAAQNWKSGERALLTINDSTITTHGDDAQGLRSIQGGTIFANRSEISTGGANAIGLFAWDDFNGLGGAHDRNPSLPVRTVAGSITVDQTTVTTTGALAHGAVAQNGAIITGTSSTIKATGTDAMALYVVGASKTIADPDPLTFSTASFTDSTLVNGNGPTIGTAGPAGISLKNTVIGTPLDIDGRNGNRQWLLVGKITDFPALVSPPYLPDAPVTDGLANIAADGSRLTGSAITLPGNISNVTLSSNTLWDMTGNSNLTNLVNDASFIRYSRPEGAYKTLTAVNYTGVNDARILLNTYLGTDGSPSDLLVIDGGKATGLTGLVIENTTGDGRLTLHDGIKVVDAINGATTDPGSFTLAHRVAAGAWEYYLYRGGRAETGGDPDDQDWYLRNTETQQTDKGQEEVPIIRPEVPINTVVPALATRFGYAMLGTLHERVGQEQPRQPLFEEHEVWCKNPAHNFRCIVRVPARNSRNGGENGWFPGGWARLIGDRGISKRHRFPEAGPGYDYMLGAFQVGLDIWGREANGTIDKIGLSAGYGRSLADVKGQYGVRAGTIRQDGLSAGAYWTHYDARNWYTDAVVQATFYNTETRSVPGEEMHPKGVGLIASLEGGYTFKLADNWFIEPQAQVAYQRVSFDTAQDSFGIFHYRDLDSLRGRIGLRVGKTWMRGEGASARPVTAWLQGNLWREFMGDSKMRVTTLHNANAALFTSQLGGTWAEIKAGISGQVTDKISAFAVASYGRSLDNRGQQSWGGRLGITVRW